jgi:pyridinium-3,5-biscarboxylic acid mononucleotide sulfurtransferase
MRQQSLEKVIKNILDDKNSLPTVAVSGGIDSLSLAVFISKLYITKKINIAHAIGPAVPREATNRVKTLAKEYNWNLNIINTNEINDPRYKANPINRCFFCKENLYSTIKNYTQGIIFSGANLDDLSDYRPGLDAAKEANVIHPFVLAKIDKKAIRQLASELGLGELSELPSSPCLASRVQTGIPVTSNLLNKIDKMERLIKKIIPGADIRCRWMLNNLSIQFNQPKLENINIDIKKLITAKASGIFSVKETSIELNEYKKGSAFILNKENS